MHSLQSFRSRFSDCIRELICKLLSGNSVASTLLQDRSMWVGIPNHTSGNNEYISSALGLLRENISSTITIEDCLLQICKSAHFISFDKYGTRQRSYAYQLCHGATQFRLLLRNTLNERFVHSVHDGKGMRRVWMLLGIIKRDKDQWVVAKQMRL